MISASVRLRAASCVAALALSTVPASAERDRPVPQALPSPASFEDKAPLWNAIDPRFQKALEDVLDTLELSDAVEQRRLGIALVDITNPDRPTAAAVNADEMMYAASLPKIAILLAAFDKIEHGTLERDEATMQSLARMIRFSSNSDASAIMNLVGKAYIAEVLTSPRYRFYDPHRGGGIWAGKNYGEGGVWQRDPLLNLSHAATPMQIARFYYMLARGDLVSPTASREMLEILSKSGVQHKFVAGMNTLAGTSRIHRKSGTWIDWHSDSALIEHRGRTFIAVALCEHPDGERWLEELIVEMNELVRSTPVPGEEIFWVRKSGPRASIVSRRR